MKKLLFIAALVCLCACSKDFDQIPGQNDGISNQNSETHKIDGIKAYEIANLYFNRSQTRSTASLKMEYIVETSKTRNGLSDSDTIAYILNRGVNDGFVLVSSDDRVYPILAHSESGTFNYEKGDLVETEFISRLGAYLEENVNNTSRTVTASDLDACATSFPILTTSWSQDDPWNKYVVREHPGCPAGCVAVATGMIMSHCKPSHNYHGISFDFARIISGLKTNYYPWENPLTRIVGGVESGSDKPRPEVEPYSREVAVDYAAKLLYWIGKDVDMSYSSSGSGAGATRGYSLLKSEGYKLKHSGLITYNVHEALKQLKSNNLVYMRGSDVAGRGGHAWVADAYSYCVDWATNDTIAAEIHCDWGWGGSCNGFYSGEVFSAGPYKFGNMQCFAVGIE